MQERSDTFRPLLTPEEVAEILRLDLRTVRRHLRDGVLVGIKVGRVWRVRPADLDAFIAQGAVNERPSH